jgi:hypothetical protein
VFHSYVQYCYLCHRSYKYPEGTPEALADPNRREVLNIANDVADNTINMADELITAGVCVSFENPQASTLRGAIITKLVKSFRLFELANC